MPRAIRLAALAIGCVVLLPTGLPAAPQIVNQVNGIGLIDYARRPDLKLGTWAQYRVTGSSEMGMQDDYLVTVLIAGEERFWGEDCFWVETWTEPTNRPPQAVATLMSYSIFDDSLAIPHLKLYMRKFIGGVDEEGNAIQTVTKRPSGSLTSRKPPSDQLNWYVDTLGSDTAMVPRGTFKCTKVSMRQGIAASTDVGDSTLRTETREDRVLYLSPEVPLTSIVREDIETSMHRKSWKTGQSKDAPTNVMDEASGSARLVDFGTGLTPQVVPEIFRQTIRRAQPARKQKVGEGTAKTARSRAG